MGLEKSKTFRELLSEAGGLNFKTGKNGKYQTQGETEAAMDTIEENL